MGGGGVVCCHFAPGHFDLDENVAVGNKHKFL